MIWLVPGHSLDMAGIGTSAIWIIMNTVQPCQLLHISTIAFLHHLPSFPSRVSTCHNATSPTVPPEYCTMYNNTCSFISAPLSHSCHMTFINLHLYLEALVFVLTPPLEHCTTRPPPVSIDHFPQHNNMNIQPYQHLYLSI